jgi:hypothetical protein
LGLEAISLDQLHASNFFGDIGNKVDCILWAIKEVLRSSCLGGVRKSYLKVIELLNLSRLEKGSLLFDTKQKSFQKR